MHNRALFHSSNDTCYIVPSINTSSSRLNRFKVFQSCSFLWVRDSCFLTSSLKFFLPGLCPLALVQVWVPRKDLDLHGIPSGLYTVSTFLPSFHFARACKASSRLDTLFLHYPNHPFLSFPPYELNFWDNQNCDCTQSFRRVFTAPWRMPSAFAFLPKPLTSYCNGSIYSFHGHVPSVAHDHFVIN